MICEMVGELIDALGKRAGDYDCGYQSESRSWKRSELMPFIRKSLPSSITKVDDYVSLVVQLCKENGHWGIVVGRSESDEGATDFSLESKIGKKSLWCRFMLSARTVLGTIAVICLILGAGFGVILFVRYRQHVAESERRQVFDLVERVVDMLRQNAAASEATSQDPMARPLPAFLAIPHVRDALIPLHERRAKQHIWDQAVSFLSANESRIRVESQKIAGEDFAVWRWIQPVMDGTKVWQGQAFGENTAGMRSRNRASVPQTPLTTCLKVRNMFNASAETGNNWQTVVKDAVLDKCAGAKIIHVALDESTTDGCVYIRCSDLQSAGISFKALHGWWFDGRLVTVKYLREQRYEERYPESRDAVTPLEPSTSARLSLSQPFHCSAIENS
jgi:membrane protein Man1